MALDISTARLDIAKIYIAAFNRAPDASGLDFWTKAYMGGSSLASIANGFASSAEYANKYPSFLTNTEYVAAVYNNVFGRAVDTAGSAYWTAALDAGTVTKATLLNALVSAATASSTNTDGMRLNNMADFGVYAAINGVSATTANSQLISITSDSATLTAAKNAAGTVNTSYTLTTSTETIYGTINDDTFTAYVSGNANTLNSGDKIYGGTNTSSNTFSSGEVVGDVLSATLGSDSNFAITPITSGVETVSIRVQSTDTNGNSGENNVTNHVGQAVTVDAQDMVGVQTWENTDSRADLTVEDVRILNGEITKDITIAWRNADSGSTSVTSATGGVVNNETDYRLYFSPESLRNVSSSTSAVTIRVADDQNDTATPTTPLKNVYLDITGLTYNGVSYNLGKIYSTDGTYAGLATALNTAFAAKGLTGLSAAVGSEFNSIESGGTTRAVLGTNLDVVITGLKDKMLWSVAKEGVTQNNTASDQVINSSTSSDLITSRIILDNVGRESEAGILEVGSMSTRSGVEKFEVWVDSNSDNSFTPTQSGSWVSSMRSTNNILQEIEIKKQVDTTTTRAASNVRTVDIGTNSTDAATNPDYLYIGSGMDPYDNTAASGNNLTTLRFQPVLLQTDGITDVRVFDASAMTGELKLGASITSESIRKYMNTIDNTTSPSAANIAAAYDQTAFKYTAGSNNDTMNIELDGAVAASRSTIVSGREDFTFSVDGGAGNDIIQLAVVDGLAGNGQNWYSNQDYNNNITVSGGAGDDIIMTPGAGDVNINGNAGADIIYADNTGRLTAKVALVSNDGVLSFLDASRTSTTTREDSTATSYNTLTSDNTSLDATYINATTTGTFATYVFNADDTAGRNGLYLDDLRGYAPSSASGVNGYVTVNYKGLTSKVYLGSSNAASTNQTISDLDINQAIKKAINDDATLSALLTANDGAGRTLVVTSKIDGSDTGAADLSISFGADALSASQTTANLTLFTNATGYANLVGGYTTTDFAQDNTGMNLVGANSTSTSDNTINGGTGNDVIVLGTTAGTDATSVYDDSNDVVVYDTAAFGDDTIVHFTATGAGVDTLDFSKLGSAVTVAAYAAATNGDATKVKALYTDSTTASNKIYIAYNGIKGTVYQVTDGTATGDLAVTSLGTINLATDNGTAVWSALTAANFAGTTYNSGTVTGGTGGTGGSSTATVAIAAAGTTTDGGSTVSTTYNVTNGTYTHSIAGFGTGDKLVFATGNATASVSNTSFTDGSVTVQSSNASSGTTVTITLTGLTNAQDAALNSAADFNTLFGAGTIA